MGVHQSSKSDEITDIIASGDTSENYWSHQKIANQVIFTFLSLKPYIAISVKNSIFFFTTVLLETKDLRFGSLVLRPDFTLGCNE